MHPDSVSSSRSDRPAPLEMPPDEFRRTGHRLVERIATFLESIPDRPVTPDPSVQDVRDALPSDLLPEEGTDSEMLVDDAADLLFTHSLLNGHPRFWGYITSSASPIGALGDMLAAVVNSNVGAWTLAPIASEIEMQTVRWIAQMIDFPSDCGGLLVSGGNMANFVGFLAGRSARADWNIREEGLRGGHGALCAYVSAETHTWIQKAADLFGLGTDAIRWIAVDAEQRMECGALREQIRQDRADGRTPFLVVGTAGTVSTGAVDPLAEIAEICRHENLWFHVDGAYGALAAVVPEQRGLLAGMQEANSVALDPHKWLYSPLEAGCLLVRDPQMLIDAFSFRPPYYNFADTSDDTPINFFEFGFQNSRGFRALKVWLGIRQVGASGYRRMISDDIRLAGELYRLAEQTPELEAISCNLSITTFRYVPTDIDQRRDAPDLSNEDYLNQLNRRLLNRLQSGGELYVSNAVINGMFALRACVVNFRTTLEDIRVLPEIVVREGRTLHTALGQGE